MVVTVIKLKLSVTEPFTPGVATVVPDQAVEGQHKVYSVVRVQALMPILSQRSDVQHELQDV